MLERSFARNTEQGCGGRRVCAEHIAELGRCPYIGQTLDAIGVRIQCRCKPAVWSLQIPQQEVGSLPGDPLRQRRTGAPPPMQIDAQQ